jgi:cholesterol transport system auxiliary component
MLALAVLSGCSGLLHSHARPSQVYVLRAASQPQARTTSVSSPSASLHVQRAIAGPGLDTEHIVLVQSDHRMSFYAASSWPAALPDLVEELAVDSLHASGAWGSVQDSSSTFPSEYVLQIVIRRFEADYTANPALPEIHVVFDCTIGRRSNREVLASYMAEGSATAAANRLADVVTAFESASNQALAVIVQRSAQAVLTAAEPGKTAQQR